ncbi:MAG: hypothetical protein IPL39_19725 [Opitutaceae bacterium]|nr:hypothetical protein [Opitutaceae bacterium]
MNTNTAPLCLFALLPAALLADPSSLRPSPAQPPPPPPVLRAPASPPSAAAAPSPQAAAGVLYSIGSPTDDEQYCLELINRARAHPAVEGGILASTSDPDVLFSYDYFDVDLTMLQNEFAALPARPPLAPNALLAQAARVHNSDMYVKAFQSHTGSDGRTMAQRVDATGYVYSMLGENIFSYAKSLWAGHAGFEVDWGNGGTGGMQVGRGHRANIHGAFNEVGLAVIKGSRTVGTNTVGPHLLTQDFGTSALTFVTGVAFFDLDGDQTYDAGEGVGGITVEVEGSGSYAVTTSSGGYAVPVPAATATPSVSFTAADLSQTGLANLAAGQNAKVDFSAPYLPPTVTAEGNAYVGHGLPCSFTAVGAAASYDWVRARKVDAPTDPAETLVGITVAITGTYSALATNMKYAGEAAYHLAHPTPDLQTLTYPGLFHVGPAGSLRFYSRLGWATSTQLAQVEVSTTYGNSWQVVDSQAGTGGAGQLVFGLRTVSLSAYANQAVLIRFAYRSSGDIFSSTGLGVGWYLDEIAFTDLHSLLASTTTPIPTGRSFTFTPTATGPYLLAARPRTLGRTWPYGPFLEVTAVTEPPFSTWAGQQETAAGLPAGTIELHPEGDINGDGVSNLVAYALGLSATSPASPPAAGVSEGRLRLGYARDTAKNDLTVAAQLSTDLLTWYEVGGAGAPADFTDNLLASVGTQQTREASVSSTSGNRLFLRLRVVRP